MFKKYPTKPKPQFVKEGIVICEKKNFENIDKSKLIKAAIGGIAILEKDGQALFTRGLASCYAIIVVGEKEKGQKIAALCHWVGSEDSANDTILDLKEKLETRGADSNSIKTFAIGGMKDCSPDVTAEIKDLVTNKKIEYALCDLNTHDDRTSVMISLNKKNEFMINYPKFGS